MQIVVRSPGHEWDLAIPDWRATTFRQLAGRLGIQPGDEAAMDGRLFKVDIKLGDCPLHLGSVVEFGDPLPAGPPPVVDLGIVAGRGSGIRLPLAAGEYAIGGSAAANVVIAGAGLSTVELLLRVSKHGLAEVRPLDTPTPKTVDGATLRGPTIVEAEAIVTVGRCAFRVLPHQRQSPTPTEHPRRRGTSAFNRPPRTLAAPTVPSVTIPPRPPPPTPPPRFRWATALAPLAAGIAMAFLFSPFMLIFALLSPVMVTANWFEDRARRRRESRDQQRDLEASLSTLEHELTALSTMERNRSLRNNPDMAETASRSLNRGDRLWERRRPHPDFLHLLAGYAAVPWEPPIQMSNGAPAAEAESILAGFSELPMCPVTVDLRAGRVVGVTGNREQAVGLAAALLVQAAVHHGPADIRIAVITQPDRRGAWDWAKWLPHAVLDRSAEQRWLASKPSETDNLIRLLAEAPEPRPYGEPAELEPTTVLVVDLDQLADEDHAPLRDVLAGMGKPVSGIVVGDQLPSSCTTVLEAASRGTTLRLPGEDIRIEQVLPLQVGRDVAGSISAALARFEDPDLRQAGTDLPADSRLAGLLGLEEISPSRILARWRDQAPGSLSAPVGEVATGPLLIDLVTDGPHGLVAGTTGSGKSELLRTMVASMAASVDPGGLNFVLIDYKGGSAFDACAQLPHTVGLVTDLDAHLGERALVSLEAELRYREGRLRQEEVTDIGEYQRASPVEPLPRLVVIIDEFAALAKELPAFVASLVDIAQRGRSLGVHMLLATQRPSGVVSENIRANTNLRIALRVQDGADSTDVVGDQRAASIGRRLPGRAFLRLGPAETFPFQAALVTGCGATDPAPAQIQAFEFANEPDGEPIEAVTEGPTDLENLVAAIGEAAAAAGYPPARRPWLEALPPELGPAAVPVVPANDGVGVTVGLLDDPYRQAQVPFSWSAGRGNLLIFGAAGAGTSTALLTVATRLASAYPPDLLHLYGIDYDAQTLLSLRPLPHTGAMVAADDFERQQRLIRMLRATVEERRRRVATRSQPDTPAIILLLDEYAGLRAAFDEAGDHHLLEALNRVIADGPGLGVYTVATAKRASAFPSSVGSVVAEKLIMNLADPTELSGFGLYGSSVPAFVPGRAINLATGHEVQLARPLPIAEIGGPPATHPPAPIAVLPTQLKVSEIIDQTQLSDDMWHLPVGVGDSDLAVVGWQLGEGEGALVTGSSRSGRSTTLVSIAAIVARHRPDVQILAFAPRSSPLRDLPEVTVSEDDPGPVLQGLAADGRFLVLIDDAEFVDDASGSLQRFLAGRPRHVRLIAAGRSDVLRTTYGHWTQEVRRGRSGLILDPSPLTDGDLFAVQLPRPRDIRFPTGRGYLVSGGEIELTQAARP